MASSVLLNGSREKEYVYVPTRILTLTFHWPGLWSPDPEGSVGAPFAPSAYSL